MKKLFALTAMLAFTILSSHADAQMMMPWGPNTTLSEIEEHTKQEEAEGKEIWEKLQSKQATCASLSDEDFAALGEYFMGQMMGPAHAGANQMMIRAHGEEGEEQIHVVMGKRLSGCEQTASFPTGNIGGGWMPMMWGGWTGANPGMMGFQSFAWTGWITTLLIWALLVLAIAALWKRVNKN